MIFIFEFENYGMVKNPLILLFKSVKTQIEMSIFIFILFDKKLHSSPMMDFNVGVLVFFIVCIGSFKP